MASDLLCDLSPVSKHWTICARVAIMWDYCGTRNNQAPIHVYLVLVDAKGNALYADIPGSEVDKLKKIVQESKIHKFSKFLVCPSKPAYKPFPNRYMIKMTPSTKMVEVKENVRGLIVGVSKVAYIRMASNSSDTPKRVINLKDISNCEVKLVLWGQRTLDFDVNSIYELGQKHAVVGIFVGTLMKAYNREETLSRGSACRWYINEDIPEINEFFDSLSDDGTKVQWISLGAESFGSSRRQACAEHKTVAEIKNIDPWETQASSNLCTVTVAKLNPSQPW